MIIKEVHKKLRSSLHIEILKKLRRISNRKAKTFKT